MYQLILIVHILAAVCLIALVLVQQGKGATAGAAFGSGASQTVFGSRGSGSFLLRVTTGFVAVFFSTSLLLNYMASQAIKRDSELLVPATTHTMPGNTAPTPSSIPNNTAQAQEAAEPVVPKPAATTPVPVLPQAEKPVVQKPAIVAPAQKPTVHKAVQAKHQEAAKVKKTVKKTEIQVQ